MEDDVAAPDFIAHDKADSVGVIVVETVKAKTRISGWVMENDKTIRVDCLDNIPIGHKVALKAIKEGDTIIKYGHDIGKAVADIPKGGHVHTHNVKTKRW